MSLTQGSILDLINETKEATIFHPTVQVIDIRKIAGSGTDRYRVIISDGRFYAQSMLTTQLNSLVEEDKLRKNAIVKLNEYICNNVQARKIVIILKMEIVVPETNKIGDPIPIEKANTSQAPMPNQGSGYNPSAPQSNGSGIRAPDVGYTPIMALNPYQNRWKLKARVANKAPIKEWSNARGQGKLFSMELVDSNGDDIRCTFFKEAVDAYYTRLEKGKVYTFQNGRLKIGNPKYNNCKSEYEITFGMDVQIEGPFEDREIRSLVYKITKISNLANINPETSGMVDICGIVQSDSGLKELTSKAGKELKKRDLTIVDDSGSSINVTLWGEKAEMDADSFANNPTVLFKGTRLSDYGGRSISTTFSTVMMLNSDLPEATNLKAWWESQGSTQVFTPLSEARSGAGTDRSGIEWRKTVNAIKAENMGSVDDGKGGMKPSYINTKAFVTFLKKERWCYPSDPVSMKKLIEPGYEGGKWRNEQEDKEYDEPCWRYLLYMQVADHTGAQWCNAFGDKALPVFNGMSANDLKKLEQTDPTEFRNTFERILFKQLEITLQIKTETYNDETRTKCSIFRANPVKFVDENKKLLDGIQKYMELP